MRTRTMTWRTEGRRKAEERLGRLWHPPPFRLCVFELEKLTRVLRTGQSKHCVHINPSK